MLKIGFSKTLPKTIKAHVVTVGDKLDLSTTAKAFDKKSNGALSASMKAVDFKGKVKTIKSFAALPKLADQVFTLGVGDLKSLKQEDFEGLGSAIVKALNAAKVKKAVVQLDPMSGVDDAEAAAQIAMGAVLASYRFDKYRTTEKKDKKPSLTEITFVMNKAADAKKAFAPMQKIADGVFFTRDLVTEPGNELYPDSFAKIVKKELTPLGVKVQVLGEAQMKKLGMNSLLSVGHGSEKESKLVIMQYNGAPKSAKATDKQPICFVGKGITFDTGGISLKPGAGMWDMKFDMGGAGAVVGAMKAIAGRKAKANVIAAIACAENMPSDRATRPGDVVKSMSGQTIEILNTDAEGRLVLADALTYMQKKHKPKLIIDLATLTGAMLVALGHEFAGVFSNDDDLAAELVCAGKGTGDHVWHMPMTDVWDKQMNSDIADVKNISNSRYAGSATAAAFLSRFIEKDMKWAHLDIAGTAWRSETRPTTPKGATGYGVRLLDQFVKQTAEK